MTSKDWIQDPDLLPPLTYPDIVNYLVFGLSAYTLREFKSYKSLEAHEQFCNGWVQDLLIHKPENCDNTVVLAKVRLPLFDTYTLKNLRKCAYCVVSFSSKGHALPASERRSSEDLGYCQLNW